MCSPRRSPPHRYRVAPVREYTADEWCDTLLRGWYGGATVTERQGPMPPPPPPLPPPLPTTAPTSGKAGAAEPSVVVSGGSSGSGDGGDGDGGGWVAAARGAALSTARTLVSPLEWFVLALAFLAVDGARDGAHAKGAPRSAVGSAAVDEPSVLPTALPTALTTARLPAGWQCAYDSATGRPYYADARGHTTWERPTQPCAPGTAPGATAPDTAAAVGVGAVVGAGMGAAVGADAVVGVTPPPIRPESVDLAQFCEMLTSELVCIWGDCARLRSMTIDCARLRLMTIDCLPHQASAIGSRTIDCARLRLMTIDCLPHQASAIGSRSAAGSPSSARRTRSMRATRPGTLIAADCR